MKKKLKIRRCGRCGAQTNDITALAYIQINEDGDQDWICFYCIKHHSTIYKQYCGKYLKSILFFEDNRHWVK